MENKLTRSTTLSADLRRCLESDDKFELIELQSRVSFTSILKANERNFADIQRTDGIKELAKYVTVMTKNFLQSCFPNQVALDVDISLALIQREPTWILPDVLNFYKTILMRQDLEAFKVFGNQITIIRLMEMVAEYEGLKADERERLWNEKKNDIPSIREASDNSIKSLMGKELERIQIRDDEKKIVSAPADQKWFDQLQNEIDDAT